MRKSGGKTAAVQKNWMLVDLAHHLGCFKPLARPISQHDKNDEAVKETTEKNHESIQTDRPPFVASLARRDCVYDDGGKNGERRSEWESYHLKDGVSSNHRKSKEANRNY